VVWNRTLSRENFQTPYDKVHVCSALKQVRICVCACLRVGEFCVCMCEGVCVLGMNLTVVLGECVLSYKAGAYSRMLACVCVLVCYQVP